MNEHAQLRSQIIATFGKQAYTSAGPLDRDYLGKLAFADPAALDALNALVHPVVAADADSWHAAQSAPYTLHEAAILYEIGAAASYRAIVVVACPIPLRKQRVLKRDSLTPEAFEQRAARQWSDDKKEAAADYLIQNDGRALLPSPAPDAGPAVARTFTASRSLSRQLSYSKYATPIAPAYRLPVRGLCLRNRS